jgi:hypothetical protein
MDKIKVREQMTAREDRERGKETTTPGRLPDTTPEVYPGKIYDFTLQAVYDMKGTLGELKKGIETLTEQVKDNDKKLDRIALVVYAASAVAAILCTIGGVILKAAWEIIAPILKEHIH